MQFVSAFIAEILRLKMQPHFLLHNLSWIEIKILTHETCCASRKNSCNTIELYAQLYVLCNMYSTFMYTLSVKKDFWTPNFLIHGIQSKQKAIFVTRFSQNQLYFGRKTLVIKHHRGFKTHQKCKKIPRSISNWCFCTMGKLFTISQENIFTISWAAIVSNAQLGLLKYSSATISVKKRKKLEFCKFLIENFAKIWTKFTLNKLFANKTDTLTNIECRKLVFETRLQQLRAKFTSPS